MSGIAQAERVDGDAAASQSVGRLQRFPRHVAAVGDEQDIRVGGVVVVDDLPRAIESGANPRAVAPGGVAAQTQRFQRGVRQLLREAAIIGGQRAQHGGTLGEGDEAKAIAARTFQVIGQVAQFGPGAFESIRFHVLGQHAAADIQDEDHIPAFARRKLFLHPAPLRSEQSDAQKKDAEQEQNTLDDLPDGPHQNAGLMNALPRQSPQRSPFAHQRQHGQYRRGEGQHQKNTPLWIREVHDALRARDGRRRSRHAQAAGAGQQLLRRQPG